jgi:hypothetical protein
MVIKKLNLFICCLTILISSMKESHGIDSSSFIWKTVAISAVALSCVPLVEKICIYYKRKTRQQPEIDLRKTSLENVKEIGELKATIEILQKQIAAHQKNDQNENAQEKEKEKNIVVEKANNNVIIDFSNPNPITAIIHSHNFNGVEKRLTKLCDHSSSKKLKLTSN